MGADKQGSKSGGSYVGGFLQLFDWNAKSRKKLFSNLSELPERSKHGKKREGNSPMSRLNLTDEDATIAGSSIRGSSDYSCASSVTDDEAYVSKPPGVVARLMGLDSLPTPNFAESYSTPLFDTQSIRDAHYQRKNHEFHQNHQISHSGNLLNTIDAPDRNTSDFNKSQKMPSRPIEKFQTEILPPKSAKPIPITHNKLLSPIKNPSFIPTKNAAHIMEAAAKIIDPGPQATTKSKRPLVWSSSIPLKVQDLKEKIDFSQKKILSESSSSVPFRVRVSKERGEAAMKSSSKLAETSRRPIESNATKCLKGQSMNKSWDGPDTTSFRVLPDRGLCSSDSKNNGKSISLALQAKVNVQKREGISSSGNRSLSAKKEQNEINSSQAFKIPNSQMFMHKKSPVHNNLSGVLTQNNQKQNCVVDKNKLPPKPSIFVSQSRKQLSGDSSLGRHRNSGKLTGNSKIGSRKMGSESTGDGNEVLYSSTKNFPRKKRIINREFQTEKNNLGFELADKYENPSQSNNTLTNSHFNWDENSRKNGNDVISFTFTAPMTRSSASSESSNQRNNGVCTDYRGKRVMLNSDRTKLSSSLGFNVIGSDALSILLEQKLREVTIGVGSSTGDSASILQHFSPTFNSVSNGSNVRDKISNGLFSNDALLLRSGHKFQGMNEMNSCSNSHIEARHPSPVSILEPSFSTESYNSSASNNSNNITEGSKQCSLKKLYSVDSPDTELLDSASSTSVKMMTRNHAVTDYTETTKWELEYIKEILSNLELMFNDFSLGRVTKIINPRLFHHLENKKEDSKSVFREQRKVLFDCIGECLDIRIRSYVGGGPKAWAKGVVTMVRRKERLAEEVYKEILEWGKMGDSMVDELVDKDMSSRYGKWADYEVEGFEVGLEIENLILKSLVNEVVADIFKY